MDQQRGFPVKIRWPMRTFLLQYCNLLELSENWGHHSKGLNPWNYEGRSNLLPIYMNSSPGPGDILPTTKYKMVPCWLPTKLCLCIMSVREVMFLREITAQCSDDLNHHIALE